MNIAIIDADLIGRRGHRFPNLVCMKLSAYYKELGNNTRLITEYDKNILSQYEKIFLSKVFTDTEVPKWVLELDNIEYGGTGFFYDKAPHLPYEIEHHMPDYHLYDDWVNEMLSLEHPRKEGKPKYKRDHFKYYLDYSIGFTTRGCFRKCGFCVNKNYNRVNLHSPLSEFLDDTRPKICLLDDNVLGCKDWRSIFESLQETGKPFQYKQGLDERLLNDEKVMYLKNSKYDGDYIFAFDNIDDKDIVIKKAEILRKHFNTKGQKIKFYVLCAYDKNDKYDEEFWKQDIKDTFERMFILAKYNFKPYVMRYEKYKESPYHGVYTTLSRWCNPSFFFNRSFEEFCIKDDGYNGGKKQSAVYRYYEQMNNDEFREYITVRPRDLVDQSYNTYEQ